jgi:hypothetical protein
MNTSIHGPVKKNTQFDSQSRVFLNNMKKVVVTANTPAIREEEELEDDDDVNATVFSFDEV